MLPCSSSTVNVLFACGWTDHLMHTGRPHCPNKQLHRLVACSIPDGVVGQPALAPTQIPKSLLTIQRAAWRSSR